MDPLAAFAAGATVGVLVTAMLHGRVGDRMNGGFWSHRVGGTRFRMANLPVGGALAVLASLALPHLAVPLLAAGGGMALAAVGARLVDPLAKVRSPATP